MKRHDDEAQRKREERRRGEEGKLREEQSRREADAKDRRDGERKKREEREEEEKKKLDEEAKAMRQQEATLSVLRVIQSMGSADLDNFEGLKKQLADVMVSDLPHTGSQQEILKTEAARVLEFAEGQVDSLKEQQGVVTGLLKELEVLVDKAEAASAEVMKIAEPLLKEQAMEDKVVFSTAKATEDAGNAAILAASLCADFLLSKRAVIEAAAHMKEQSDKVITELRPRIQVATRQATEALHQAKTNKEKIIRKSAAGRRLKMNDDLFKKYDKDRDGFLSINEVVAYAKGVYNFELPEENKARIQRQLIGQDKGVALTGYQQLKTAVGIARDENRAKIRREEKLEKERLEKVKIEEKKKELEEKRLQACTIADGLLKQLKEKAEPALKNAEDATAALGGAELLPVDKLKETSEAVETHAREAEEELATVKANVDNLIAEVSSTPELEKMMTDQIATLSTTAEGLVARLTTVRVTAANARQLAEHSDLTEFETKRLAIATSLRSCMEGQGKSVDDLFDCIVGTSGKTAIGVDDVMKFLEGYKDQVTLDKDLLSVLFPSFSDAVIAEKMAKAQSEAKAQALEDAAEGKDSEKKDAGKDSEKKEAGDKKEKAAETPRTDVTLTKDEFTRLVRVYYKVVKEIVLSDNLHIGQSKQIRRMNVGEVMEVTFGPACDTSIGIYRVNVRAFKDGLGGWVTVAGSQGATFLQPGGAIFRVVHPVIMSTELRDVDGTDSVTVTTLQTGDVVEAIEWARTSRSSLGVSRVKGRSGAGLCGWVTIMGNDGMSYLEAL